MKIKFWIIACWMAVWCSVPVKAQTYHFPTVYSPANCAYTYEINITIRLDSVEVTNIYFDDGTTGSFGFKAFMSYDNTISNSTLPAGDFYTFDLAVFSDNPSLNSNELTNNLGIVPLQTAAAGGFSPQNNPTYNGSASALGLVLGEFYSAPSLLNTLGYDSAILHINLPCLDTTISGGQILPLPVLWSNITVSVDGKDVSLTWQTFMEQNNLGFTIERSQDVTRWHPAGFIASKAPGGNSDQSLSYVYKQTEPFTGRYFYRVRQQDIDGRSVVSNVVSASITDRDNSNELVVFPNPSSDALYLQQIPSNSKFLISDINGRIVLQGYYQNRIDISTLSIGLYWISAEGKVSRFMVAKTR